MENNTIPLNQIDPRWGTEVLSYFRNNNYAESLPRAIRYLEELKTCSPNVWRELTPAHFATIYYTVAASAYGILKNCNDKDGTYWKYFFDFFSKYVEKINNPVKKRLYPGNAETLLENALDLLIHFQPEQLAVQAKHWVSRMIYAWDDKLALSVLLKKVFDERMDFKHEKGMEYTRILAEIYLELAETHADHYKTERAAVMNILSDLTYFEGKENSEDKALAWIEKSLKLNPNDEFAKRRKKYIHESMAIKDQIRRFNHDTNNEIGGLKSNLQKLQQLLEDAAISEQSSVCLQKINNAIQRMAGVHRFLQKQKPEFKSIDIVTTIIKPLTASYEESMTIRIVPETPLLWEVDADYLLIAINNLIKNSAEAFERNQLEVQKRLLAISLTTSSTGLEIVFRDNAGGIDEKLREHIFEPYISSKGVQKETGLGLSIAKTAIERMEGSLRLAFEQPENGTVFIINLTQ